MEFNDIENAVSTADFYDFTFPADGKFTDDVNTDHNGFETKATEAKPVEDDVKDLFDYSGTDADDTAINPLDEYSDEELDTATDLMQGEALGDFVSIGGANYEREHVERAVEAYAGVKAWSEDVNAHFEELDAFEMQLNQLEGIAHAELNSYISQLEDVINNERVDPVQRMEAYKEMQKYQRQQAEFNKGYTESYNALQARKQNAERLKGKAVTNELVSIGWKEKDFITASQFMRENNIVIPAISASKELMIALKKAAMFDAKQKGVEAESISSVQRAITGAPARKSNVITPDDVRMKARARKALDEGKIGTREMFDFLIN